MAWVGRDVTQRVDENIVVYRPSRAPFSQLLACFYSLFEAPEECSSCDFSISGTNGTFQSHKYDGINHVKDRGKLMAFLRAKKYRMVQGFLDNHSQYNLTRIK